MNQNSDIEGEQIKFEMAEDLVKAQEMNEEVDPRTAPGGSKSLWQSIIFTGVGVLILIIVFIVFFKSHEKAVTVDLNTVKLQLNMLAGRLTHLEKQVPELQESMSKVEEPESSLILRLDELSQQVDQLEKQMASAAMEAEAPLAVHTKPTAQAKGRYHEVRGGETLYRIAKKYGITVDELCRLNDIAPSQVIKPGQKLLVSSAD
jgi:LysM repeat protein